MYVCICNAVTEKDIHKAVEAGVNDLDKLCETTSVSKHCGCCMEHASKVLQEAMRNKGNY